MGRGLRCYREVRGEENDGLKGWQNGPKGIGVSRDGRARMPEV